MGMIYAQDHDFGIVVGGLNATFHGVKGVCVFGHFGGEIKLKELVFDILFRLLLTNVEIVLVTPVHGHTFVLV